MRLLRHLTIFSFCAAVLMPTAAGAQQAPTADPTSPPAVSPQPAKPPSIMQAITRAKGMLRDELAKRQKAEKEPKVVWSKNAELDIVLAVWNRTTDAITLYPAKKRGSALKITTPNAPQIDVTFNSTIYSQYRVTSDPAGTVVGVIYPTLSSIKVKKKNAYVLHPTVYTPYNSSFFVPELLSAGSNYLSYLIQDAFDDMRAKSVRSRAFPDKLLVDVVEPYLIKSVVVTEHTSPATLVNGDPEHAIGRFLIELATNKDDAFDLALSSAGAAGLVQFIPSTYKLMVRNWPELKLSPDFKAGMSDHKNAIKAQTALLDANLAAMPQEIRDRYATGSAAAGELMAAAYNGGSVRVKRAYDLWGDDWSADHQKDIKLMNSQAAVLKSRIATLKKQIPKIQKAKDKKAAQVALAKAQNDRASLLNKVAVIRKAALKNETFWYVAKIKKAYGMFTSGAFATPEAPSGGLPIINATGVASADATGAPLTPATAVTTTATPVQTICFGDGGCVPTE